MNWPKRIPVGKKLNIIWFAIAGSICGAVGLWIFAGWYGFAEFWELVKSLF
jgi:hypothetical protein